MKWIRLSAPVALALALGVAVLLLLTRSGGQVEAQGSWPLVHKNLSVSASDSTNADIEVIRLSGGTKVAVAVWMEGLSDIEIMGSVKMRWKFESASGTWRKNSTQMFPSAGDGYAYGYPAVALYPRDANSVYAHVVWLWKNPSSQQGVGYKLCTLTAAGATCTAAENLSYSDSAAPAIAVDAAGVPHVVWQQKLETREAIYYNNKAGGTWGTPFAIRTPEGVSGVDHFKALGQSPTIAVQERLGSGSVVAVAWDREVDRVSGEAGAFVEWVGIWFARRVTLGVLSTGNTEAARWNMHPVSQPSGTILPETLQDDRPKLSTGQTGIYLAWHRMSFMGPEISSPLCREYDVAYRVFLPPYTSTIDVNDNWGIWWPGPLARNYSYQTPYSATTYVPYDVAGTAQDLYSGARPSIKIAAAGSADQLHVAWQRSADASCSGGGGPLSVDEVWASGESDVDGKPLQVWHSVATHTLVTTSSLAVSAWASQQMTVQQPVNGFFASPDLSVIAGDGSPLHPHVVLLDRFKTSATAYAWDVWYVNDEEFVIADSDPTVYLPIVFKNYY